MIVGGLTNIQGGSKFNSPISDSQKRIRRKFSFCAKGFSGYMFVRRNFIIIQSSDFFIILVSG